MTKILNLISLTVIVTIVIWSVSASAGIVVTVGKHNAEAQAQQNVDDCPYDGVELAEDDGDDAGLPSVDGVPVDTAPVASANLEETAGLGGPPDSMACHDIGGGIEYCEPIGNASGAAGGGGLGDGSETQELETLGCQGAPLSSTLPWLAVGLLVLVGLRRRSQA